MYNVLNSYITNADYTADLLNKAKAEAKKAEKEAAYEASLLETKELDEDDDMDED